MGGHLAEVPEQKQQDPTKDEALAPSLQLGKYLGQSKYQELKGLV